jgi:hypothetical protein
MNKLRRSCIVTSVAAVVMLIAMSGQAFAVTKTLSASLGPIPLPNVPAQVCIDGTCVSTPALSAVSLKVRATVDVNAGTLPTITPGACPAGQNGLALTISTGSASVTVSGLISGTLPTGAPISIPVGPISIGPNAETVTISVCTTAGVPGLPGLPPGLPGLPVPGLPI